MDNLDGYLCSKSCSSLGVLILHHSQILHLEEAPSLVASLTDFLWNRWTLGESGTFQTKIYLPISC